ncbi:MAG: exodeoxyribonuclease III, partial [Bdellovibrionales bacterium]|nr:exodeoxyribonuclease III [Bdellovibrionales bacterium]
MRLMSWNVNGVRAAQRNGFLGWLSNSDADVVAIQETKASPDQLDQSLISPPGYRSFWHSAEKAGYSGVAVYTRVDPLQVTEGIGAAEFDREGRVLQLEFRDFVLINAYFPNSQREHARLPYKLAFCDAMLKHCARLGKKGKNVVICGDFNIAHEEIDLKNPKSNRDNAGFLPEERAWMTKFLAAGHADVFREREPGPGHYTWWSYRPGVREKNVGWRIDYHVVNRDFTDRV